MTREELRDALVKADKAATPGPWDIWREPIKDINDAIDEAMVQVRATDPIIDAMVLLNADGKCPAMTGCGPTSDANADLIVLLRNNLPTILASLDTEAVKAETERAVMICPQCEGEGSYADGLDEAACTETCTRCGGNGWIVDLETIRKGEAPWISHDGGQCPVDPECVVEIQTRGGSVTKMKAGAVVWQYCSWISETPGQMPSSCEVVAYRAASIGEQK